MGGGCSFPRRVYCYPLCGRALAKKDLALASSQGQVDLVGAPRQLRCLFGPPRTGGRKDAHITAKEDAGWEEPAATQEEREASLASREAGREMKQGAPQHEGQRNAAYFADWAARTMQFA